MDAHRHHRLPFRVKFELVTTPVRASGGRASTAHEVSIRQSATPHALTITPDSESLNRSMQRGCGCPVTQPGAQRRSVVGREPSHGLVQRCVRIVATFVSRQVAGPPSATVFPSPRSRCGGATPDFPSLVDGGGFDAGAGREGVMGSLGVLLRGPKAKSGAGRVLLGEGGGARCRAGRRSATDRRTRSIPRSRSCP